jgi:hypothetical protein
MPFNQAEYWKNYKERNRNKYQIKRSPLKRKPVKINPVSKSLAKALREYEKVKAEFFKEVKVCQFPGCESEELTLHHARGRIGKNLTDRSTFRGLCEYHHRHCELHPIEAKELGLSADRLTA